MKAYIQNLWHNKPLQLIILLFVITRLTSVVFSKGFGMHDDHFCVIEPAQGWAENNNSRTIANYDVDIPVNGLNLFYPGTHCYLFKAMQWFGIYNPDVKMLLVRLLHALLSLIIVLSGYKIALKIHNIKSARLVGLLLTLYFFMPFLSVRTLVEFTCIPFLMLTYQQLDKAIDRKNLWFAILAGIFLGISINIRYQTAVFAIGYGLSLIFILKWRELVALTIGAAFCFAFFQGVVDYFVLGKPFAMFLNYAVYNYDNAYTFFTGNWFNYFLLILGILIPPVSFMLLFGYFRLWKKHLLLFLPAFLFLIFHSYFPNKQERFILPVIPFIIILGVVGWEQFIEKSHFWQKRKRILLYSWGFFWVINLVLLPVISTMYSKKARVESMLYLSQYHKQITCILQENTTRHSVKQLPRFYLRSWCHEIEVTKDNPLYKYAAQLQQHRQHQPTLVPQYVLFWENTNMESRVDSMKSLFPNLQYMKSFEPGFVDLMLFKMNPYNANMSIHVYATNEQGQAH